MLVPEKLRQCGAPEYMDYLKSYIEKVKKQLALSPTKD